MPTKVNSLADAERAINEVERNLEILLGPANINLKGRRLIGAGHSKDLRDYTTREELLILKKEIQESLDDLVLKFQRLDQRVFDLENP